MLDQNERRPARLPPRYPLRNRFLYLSQTTLQSKTQPALIASANAAKYLSPARVGRPDRGVQRGSLSALVCATDARTTAGFRSESN